MNSPRAILTTVREFVDRDVVPTASKLEHDDVYPADLVSKLGRMGFFGATIPVEYGGMGLDFVTYAMCVEELCRGFMSLSGVFNTHLICAYLVRVHGTEEQRRRWLPPAVILDLERAEPAQPLDLGRTRSHDPAAGVPRQLPRVQTT